MNGEMVVVRSDKFDKRYSIICTTNKELMVAAWNVILKDDLSRQQAFDIISKLQNALKEPAL